MKNDVDKRMQEKEDHYTEEIKQLEDQLTVLSEENRAFLNYIDDSAERIRYTAQKREYDTTAAYQLLEMARDEEQLLIQKHRNEIETKLEDKQISYRKQRQIYEEEDRNKKELD